MYIIMCNLVWPDWVVEKRFALYILYFGIPRFWGRLIANDKPKILHEQVAYTSQVLL